MPLLSNTSRQGEGFQLVASIFVPKEPGEVRRKKLRVSEEGAKVVRDVPALENFIWIQIHGNGS